MSTALVSVLTALGDDELVIGHRHSEWTGFAPHIEEDVAFSSIAQDEIGHAAALYELAARHTGDEADRLAFGREPRDYHHAVVCELPNRDWAFTLARHWLYDRAEAVRLESLSRSRDRDLAALAGKLRREERYHQLHSTVWIKRIAHGPLEGRTKLLEALTETFGAARGLFEPYDAEEDALSEGWLPEGSPALLERFVAGVTEALDGLGLPTTTIEPLDSTAEFVASSSGDLIAKGTEDGASASSSQENRGGRRGRHTQHFTDLWEEMTSTYRTAPGASW